MTIKEHDGLIQGSDEWLEARRGLITASEVGLLLTPTLKIANNEKTRAHIYELAAQRISGFVEPHYVSDDMLRGQTDEMFAKIAYNENFGGVREVGFITNDRWGFTIGYSPDGLIGEDGLIEVKSRRQKFQIQTAVECLGDAPSIPPEYMLQVQTGLMVTDRAWCDFISYSGGLPMLVVRVYPDAEVQAAIEEATRAAEARIAEVVTGYRAAIAAHDRHVPTERQIYEDIIA